MTNIKTMMEELAQEELERDGAACVEVMKRRKKNADSDLISRKALIAEYDRVHVGSPGGARTLMVEAPTVEAEPVHYGRWIIINKGRDNWVECSECHTVGSPFWKRCPLCEAKMEGVGNNAAD